MNIDRIEAGITCGITFANSVPGLAMGTYEEWHAIWTLIHQELLPPKCPEGALGISKSADGIMVFPHKSDDEYTQLPADPPNLVIISPSDSKDNEAWALREFPDSDDLYTGAFIALLLYCPVEATPEGIRFQIGDVEQTIKPTAWDGAYIPGLTPAGVITLIETGTMGQTVLGDIHKAIESNLLRITPQISFSVFTGESIASTTVTESILSSTLRPGQSSEYFCHLDIETDNHIVEISLPKDFPLPPFDDRFMEIKNGSDILEAVVIRTIETLGDLTPYVTRKEIKKKLPARKKPIDAVNLEPINDRVRLWTHNRLTRLILDVTTSNQSAWTFRPEINGRALITEHGTAIIENIGQDEKVFSRLLEMLGPEGLQYTIATLAQIERVLLKKYGKLPESRNDLTPIKITSSDLLKSMGKAPRGNSYSREQQMRPRMFLKAQSMVEYADVTPLKDGGSKMLVGALVNVLDTELENTLVFDDLPDYREVLSMEVLPGKAAYSLIQKGIPWFHPQLLRYSAKKSFEIAIGAYICSLQVIRRNRKDQDWISLKAIDENSGVQSLEPTNESRRFSRIRKALTQLAKDGVVPAVKGSSGYEPIFKDPDTIPQGKLDAVKSKQVRIQFDEAIGNKYTPIASKIPVCNQSE